METTVANWLIELTKDSWPLAVLAGVLWAIYKLGKAACSWSRPIIEDGAHKTIEFLETGIEANKKNSDTLTHLMPIIQTGHLTTHSKLEKSLKNDVALARAGLEVLGTLEHHHPELQGKFASAKAALHEVEFGQ